MKRYITILSIALLTSCGVDYAKMNDAVVVEQINITDGSSPHKYEVKFKTIDQLGQAYFYTNDRLQVGDTLSVISQFFGKKDNQILDLKHQIDSLKKELTTTKLYLEIIKEKVIFSPETGK